MRFRQPSYASWKLLLWSRPRYRYFGKHYRSFW